MTAPRTCEHCGNNLDAGEICDCREEKREESPVVEATTELVMGDSLNQLPASIEFNFEALKLGLTQSLARYEGLVVTEEDIKGAKYDRARLNELREALETKRKEIKKACMVPYNDFEKKVKELVALVDKPIAAIDSQLREFEEKRRAEKREAIAAVYEETIGELQPLLPLERLWQDSWYNAGVSMKKIRESMVAVKEKTTSDLELLATVESEFAEAVKLTYLKTLDLTAALAERNRLQEKAEKLREFEARRAAMEEKREESREVAPAVAPVEETGTVAPAVAAVYLLRFECKITKDQAIELSAWLRERDIPFRRL